MEWLTELNSNFTIKNLNFNYTIKRAKNKQQQNPIVKINLAKCEFVRPSFQRCITVVSKNHSPKMVIECKQQNEKVNIYN